LFRREIHPPSRLSELEKLQGACAAYRPHNSSSSAQALLFVSASLPLFASQEGGASADLQASLPLRCATAVRQATRRLTRRQSNHARCGASRSAVPEDVCEFALNGLSYRTLTTPRRILDRHWRATRRERRHRECVSFASHPQAAKVQARPLKLMGSFWPPPVQFEPGRRLLDKVKVFGK
jgi:hypothetical protein